MLKLISQIYYKGTSIAKHNQYTWCGIVDKNGRMLKHALPSNYKEFADNISIASEVSSDMLMDHHMYDLGINQYIKRYFKLVSPSLHQIHLAPYNRDRGKYKNERIYLFHNWYDAFYNVEWYFKGVLWMFTSLRNLNNYIPFVNDIRIIRCNHDFVELFSEDALEVYSFNDIINDKYILKTSTDSSVSNKYIKALESNKQHKQKKQNVQILDNGMKMIMPDEEVKIKSSDIPDIYDYRFEIYTHNNVDEQKVTSTTAFNNKSSRSNTSHKSNIGLVLR